MTPSATTPQSQADGILRIAAYHKYDYGNTVINFLPEEHAPAKRSLSSAFRNSTTPLGELDRLPLEIINAICLELDISSLFTLRHVSVRARQIVTSLPEYKLLVTHALNCFCALLRTKSASRVTLADFYRLLCQQSCSVCGKYGNLVNLVNWNRYCSPCIEYERPGYPRMATAASARRHLKLSSKAFKSLRTMKAIPGIYGRWERVSKKRFYLVSAQEALSAALREGNPLAKILVPDDVGRDSRETHLEFLACCTLPYYDSNRKAIEIGVSCAGCYLEGRRSDSTECWKRPDMIYSRDAFLEHFKGCKQAQLLWGSSDGGRIQPAKKPWLRSRNDIWGHARETIDP